MMKKISLITLFTGLAAIVAGVVVPVACFLKTSSQGQFGIIGGAGAPTLKFLIFDTANGLSFWLLLLGASLVLFSLFCFIFSKLRKK